MRLGSCEIAGLLRLTEVVALEQLLNPRKGRQRNIGVQDGKTIGGQSGDLWFKGARKWKSAANVSGTKHDVVSKRFSLYVPPVTTT